MQTAFLSAVTHLAFTTALELSDAANDEPTPAVGGRSTPSHREALASRR